MQNATAARALRAAIVDAAHLLGKRPLAGRRQPELTGERYRIWSIPAFSYILVYDPVTKPPEILRVLHTSRDLPPLLAGLARSPEDDEPKV